jgi:hypothetical protein
MPSWSLAFPGDPRGTNELKEVSTLAFGIHHADTFSTMLE